MFKKNKKHTAILWQQLFSEFNKSLSLITDLTQLRDNFVSRIRELVSAGKVLVLMLNPETDQFRPVTGNSEAAGLTISRDKLAFWFEVNRTCLQVRKMKEVMAFLEQHEQQLIRDQGIEFIYPLIVMNKVKGMVMLGGKADGTPYHEEETGILNTFMNQAAFAFENAMLYHQQKERVRKMYRADRLATLGELAAGAAHEIRNPLTSIRSTIQYLERKATKPVDKEMMADLISEVDRINEIIAGMLSFSRPEQLERSKINLKENIGQILNLAHNSAKKKNINIELHYATPFEQIMVDPGQLKQVLINVIMNGIQAITEPAGKIMIRVHTTLDHAGSNAEDKKAGDYILDITDTGCGIPPEHLDKIYDPFFTSKPEGTGLGLSITYGIVHKHGGDIEIDSLPGKGTHVKITLPFNTKELSNDS